MGCFSWGATRGDPAVSTRLADVGCSLLLWGPGLAGLRRTPQAGGGPGGRAGCVCCVARAPCWEPGPLLFVLTSMPAFSLKVRMLMPILFSTEIFIFPPFLHLF